MSTPSYITTIVDDTFTVVNAVILFTGPPDTFLDWDQLSDAERGDVSLLFSVAKEKFPLGTMALMDVCKLADGNTFARKYASRLRVRNHRYPMTAGAVAGRSVNVKRQLAADTIKVATFGDSTANAGDAVTDYRVGTMEFPVAGQTLYMSPRLQKFALPVVYPNCQLVANGGISGETTTQMLARDLAAASATRRAAQDVVATTPDVILLRGGSSNNLSQVTPATLDAVVATAYAEHMEIIRRLAASGALIIDEGIAGFSGTTNLHPDTMREGVRRLNALYKADAEKSNGRVVWLDPVGLTCDANYNMLSARVAADGVHVELFGALAIAEAEAKIIRAHFGESVAVRYQGANALAGKELMLTTATSAIGSVATDFKVIASGCTRQNAKVEIIDGRRWQTCEFVKVSDVNYAQVVMPLPLSQLGIQVGDVWGFEVDVMIMGMNGDEPKFSNCSTRVTMVKTGAGTLVYDTFQANALDLGAKFAGHASSIPIRMAAASTEFNDVSSSWGFLVYNCTSPMWKVGVSNPRIVKLK